MKRGSEWEHRTPRPESPAYPVIRQPTAVACGNEGQAEYQYEQGYRHRYFKQTIERRQPQEPEATSHPEHDGKDDGRPSDELSLGSHPERDQRGHIAIHGDSYHIDW